MTNEEEIKKYLKSNSLKNISNLDQQFGFLEGFLNLHKINLEDIKMLKKLEERFHNVDDRINELISNIYGQQVYYSYKYSDTDDLEYKSQFLKFKYALDIVKNLQEISNGKS